MEKSESIGKLAEALAKVQGIISGAKMDSENPFFKSKYADLSSVWDACRKPLSDHGLSIIQLADNSTTDTITIETILAHSSGEWIKGSLSMKPVKIDPQSIGSCITYARRYSLAAAVGIAPEDDDGNAASGQGQGKKQEKPPQQQEQPLKTGSALHKQIEAKIHEEGFDRELFKAWLSSVSWITEKDGKLSLSTLSDKSARYLCDKWDSAKKTFNAWVDKQNAA